MLWRKGLRTHHRPQSVVPSPSLKGKLLLLVCLKMHLGHIQHEKERKAERNRRKGKT